MKKFKLMRDGLIIGETDLDMHESVMNVYSGTFDATNNYNSIRSVFKIYSSALDKLNNEREERLQEYYQQRDRLGLILVTQDGTRVPVDWVHIVDLEESLCDLRIEVASTMVLDESGSASA